MERANDPLSADPITFLLLACLLALAVINLGSPRKWRTLRQSVWRMRMGKQTLREEMDLRDRNTVGLLLVASISVALFLWQIGTWRGFVLPALIWLALGIMALLVVQAVLLWMVSTLAMADGGTSEYLYSGSLLFASTGIALLPISALIAYQPGWRQALVVLGIGMLSAMLLYRWVRGVWIGMGQGVGPGYIILYLCAAEITPLLLAFNALQHTIPTTSHH